MKLSSGSFLFSLFHLGGASVCLNGPCSPGNDYCGKPFQNAPVFHLMDQHGCGENDPNGPVYDPVHGVIHHFYQIHLAAGAGHGPDYGHFVSKDFVHWADVRTAIWNGLDASVSPPIVTKYDNEAIFTGSAFVVDGAGPDGKGPGIINLYPGLCNKHDWPACGTGTLLAQAVPADYKNDVLLINWTKPNYNPIMENTQRDPSTPWKTPKGEWRIRTYDSKVYGASSDQDIIEGKWYEIGTTPDFRTCECPSFYPLPRATPGTEAEYEKELKAGTLPSHVHKTSCGGDWWQLGTYYPGELKKLDQFNATTAWEDLFNQRRIDAGAFYASKDSEYPTKAGGKRRINWGWATVSPASAQTLPREITFNVLARTLEQAPIDELEALREPSVDFKQNFTAQGDIELKAPPGVARQSEVLAVFNLPEHASTFGITIGAIECTVEYTPKALQVPVKCGKIADTLRLTPNEATLEIRIFSDWTFLEVYLQKGRVAMTVKGALDSKSGVRITASAPVIVQSAWLYPIKTIWTSADNVRQAPRVYGRNDAELLQTFV